MNATPIWRTALLIAGIVAGSFASAQRTVTISAPVSLHRALTTVGEDYAKVKKGVTVKVVSGSTAAIRVTQGGDGRVFAHDPIVVAVRSNEERIKTFAEIGLKLELTAPDPDSTAGRSVRKTLESAGKGIGPDWQAMVKENLKGSPATATAAEAVKMVVDGKADAAIVNESAVTPHGSTLRAISVPAEYGEPIRYAAEPAEASNALAAAFVEFLFSAKSQARFEAVGLASPLRSPHELPVQRPNSMLKLICAAIPTLPQETVTVRDAQGKSVKVRGAALRSILKDDAGKVTFTGADGVEVTVPVASIRRSGGVIASMGGGNYRVVLPGAPLTSGVRWLRKLTVSPG